MSRQHGEERDELRAALERVRAIIPALEQVKNNIASERPSDRGLSADELETLDWAIDYFTAALEQALGHSDDEQRIAEELACPVDWYPPIR